MRQFFPMVSNMVSGSDFFHGIVDFCKYTADASNTLQSSWNWGNTKDGESCGRLQKHVFGTFHR